MSWVSWVGLVVVVLLLIGIGLIYNQLVTRRQRVNEAWSDIDVQLKRRHDLIPNLVETVKGYAAHERGVFDEVTRARAQAVAAGALQPAARAGAENALTAAVRSLFAVAENYPQLKAVEQFNQLSANLRDTENKIEYSRGFYNVQVRDFNTAVQTFPSMLVALPFGFHRAQFFEVAEPTERAVPKVALGS
jgi:LemA protein